MVNSEGKVVHVNEKFMDKYKTQGYSEQAKTSSSSGSSSAIKDRLNSIRGGNSNYNSGSSDIMQMIRDMADSYYGKAENALRQRTAGVIGDYTTQLKGVEDNYVPIYQNADRNAYQTNENTKAAMARAGLLNTGVGKGYDQQNAFKANMARQDIDLQKQDEYDTINTNINNTKRDLEYGLQNLLLEKANFINSQSLQEARDVRTIENENYWKERQMGLAESQFDFQKDSFNKQFSLEERKQIFAENSWNKSFELDNKKFKEMQKQFSETFGLQKEQFAQSKYEFDNKLKEEVRQFDKQFGFNAKVHADNMKMQEKQLSASIANSQRDYNMALKRLYQEQTEYNDSLKRYASEKMVDESNRVDEAISYAILNMDSKTATQYIKGLLKTSQLSQTMQAEKLKMINNALSDTTQDNGDSGFGGYDITGAGSNASFQYK